MSLINLNSESFDNTSKAPFNKLVAGIVDVTIIDVSKDDKNRWVMTYADADGGTIRDFFNYLDANHANIANQLKGQGTTLKHIWNQVVGKVDLPTFETPVEMLDTIMTAIKSKATGIPFRLVVDYGQGNRHNTRLNRKRYVPFLERNVGEATKLFMASGAFTSPAAPTDVDSLVSSGPASDTPAKGTEKEWYQ